MTNQILRHGDLILVPCDHIPPEAKQLNTKTLALGEVTGHSHTIKGQALIYETEGPKGHKYVNAQQDVILQHQEHKPIPINMTTAQIAI